MSSHLEKYFTPFRKNVIGVSQTFQTPYGKKKIIYADWTASGRLYGPIEDTLTKKFGPFVGNTHTEVTVTGTAMTKAYRESQEIIKRHVGADKDDIIIETGSGMTGAVTTLQRILGLKVHEKLARFTKIPKEIRPVVFITHMEHHSNQTSWLETICDVEIIPPAKNGLVDPENLKPLLKKHKNRKIKIAAVSAGSNVTGVMPDVHAIASIMHSSGGFCFVDYACAAPYTNINMHPKNRAESLDAIYFSPHKFLGGPGTPGILIMSSKLYTNKIPDRPGGGTVLWTNPWGEHSYLNDIEAREDGGTPPFLGTIKTALAIKLKEKMGVKNILAREKEILIQIFKELKKIPNLHILAGEHEHRLGVISFNIESLHYNLVSKLLNDRFGIQTRGGCACAGTYGHYLFHIDKKISKKITDQLNRGDYSTKPGFVRLSINPVMSNQEITSIIKALKAITENCHLWAKDYKYDARNNEFTHKTLEKPLSLKISL